MMSQTATRSKRRRESGRKLGDGRQRRRLEMMKKGEDGRNVLAVYDVRPLLAAVSVLRRRVLDVGDWAKHVTSREQKEEGEQEEEGELALNVARGR